MRNSYLFLLACVCLFLVKANFSYGYYELHQQEIFPYRSTSVQPAARLWSGWQGSYYHWIRLGDVEVWSDFLITPDFKTAQYSCEAMGGKLPSVDAEALAKVRSDFLNYKFSTSWAQAITAIEHVISTSAPGAASVFPNFPFWYAPAYSMLYTNDSINQYRLLSWQRAWKTYSNDFYKVQLDGILGDGSLTEAEALALYLPEYSSSKSFQGFTYPLYKGVRFAPEASARVFAELQLEFSAEKARVLFGVARTIEAGMKILKQTKSSLEAEGPSLGLWLEDGKALVSGESLSIEDASGVWEVAGEQAKEPSQLARQFSHAVFCMRPALGDEPTLEDQLATVQPKDQYSIDQKVLQKVNESYQNDYYASIKDFQEHLDEDVDSQRDHFVELSLQRYASRMGKSFRDVWVEIYQLEEEEKMKRELAEKLAQDRELYEASISQEIQSRLNESSSPTVKKKTLKNILPKSFRKKKQSVSSKKSISKKDMEALRLYVPEGADFSQKQVDDSNDSEAEVYNGLPMIINLESNLKIDLQEILKKRELPEDASLSGLNEEKSDELLAVDQIDQKSSIKKKSGLNLLSKLRRKKEKPQTIEAKEGDKEEGLQFP